LAKSFKITSRGERYTSTVSIADGSEETRFRGDMDEDVDGSPFWRNDPDGSPETTLRHKGKPIDSSVVRGIVVPPEIIKSTRDIVLGSLAMVTWNERTFDAVVFDVGPHSKLGEGSYALLKALGAPHTHNGSGGIDKPEVDYVIYVGVPAVIDGVEYELQPAYAL
jgi:hypothetical protein